MITIISALQCIGCIIILFSLLLQLMNISLLITIDNVKTFLKHCID